MKKFLYFVLILQIMNYSTSMKKENGPSNYENITNNKINYMNKKNYSVKNNGLNEKNSKEKNTFQQMYDLYEKDSFEKKVLKIKKVQKIFNNELHYSVYKEMKNSLQKKSIITMSEINEIEKNYIFFKALSDLEISTINDIPLIFHSVMYSSREFLKYQIIVKILTFNAKDEVLHYKNAVNNNEAICKLYLCILDKIEPQIVDSMSQLDIVEKIIHHPAMKGLSFELIQDDTLKFLKNVCEYPNKNKNENENRNENVDTNASEYVYVDEYVNENVQQNTNTNKINMSIFVQTLLSIKEDYINKQLGSDMYSEIKKIINHENIIYYFDYISKHRQYMKEFFPSMNVLLSNHFKNEIIVHNMLELKNFLQYYHLLNTEIKNKIFDLILRFCTDQIILVASKYEYNARYKSISCRLSDMLKFYQQDIKFLSKIIDSELKIQNFSQHYDSQVKKELNIAKKIQEQKSLEEKNLSVEHKNNYKETRYPSQIYDQNNRQKCSSIMYKTETDNAMDGPYKDLVKKDINNGKNANGENSDKNKNAENWENCENSIDDNEKNFQNDINKNKICKNDDNDNKNYSDDDFIEIKKTHNITAKNDSTSSNINNSTSRILIENSFDKFIDNDQKSENNIEYKHQETLCPESAKIANSKLKSSSQSQDKFQISDQNEQQIKSLDQGKSQIQIQNNFLNQNQDIYSYNNNYSIKSYDATENPLKIPDAIMAQKLQKESIIIDNSPELQNKDKLLQNK